MQKSFNWFRLAFMEIKSKNVEDECRECREMGYLKNYW